jgi:hypothetical protein
MWHIVIVLSGVQPVDVGVYTKNVFCICKTQIFDHSDSVFQLKHPFCTVYINDGKDLRNNLKPLRMWDMTISH